MRSVRASRLSVVFTAGVISVLAAPVLLSAQAWLPPKGDGSVSVGVQTISFAGHFDTNGNKLPLGSSRATNLLLGMSYSFTDRFTADLSLPYVITKYTGDPPPQFFEPTALDDGTSHSSFQDFHLDLHYNILRNSRHRGLQDLSLAPFFSLIIPSHSYAFRGESAFGHDLREYALGMSAGRLLSPFLRKAYVQGQYSYAFVQNVDDISLNHSNVDLELGYFLPHSLAVRGFGSWLGTHGGITLEQAFANPQLLPIHDRLLHASFWHLGTGASYSLNRSLDLSFTYVTYLAGSSTHYGRGITIGTTWNFSTRTSPTLADNGTSSSPPAALQR